MVIKKRLAAPLLIVLLASFGLSTFVKPYSATAVDNPSSYNDSIGQKLVTRCDLIKDYLAQTVRINELAARQNKVRGWEYILRQLAENKPVYSKFNISYSELEADIKVLKQQLEQFKVDFEAYDGAFQRLISIDCKNQPQQFWVQLEDLRSFRAGVSLAAENYSASVTQVISREEAKW
ncbi:MAG: hypothetical protein QG623_24 [Patescibacteria group bacterium]|nr:hypothetical protein [Patescibacteria group bacterium]